MMSHITPENVEKCRLLAEALYHLTGAVFFGGIVVVGIAIVIKLTIVVAHLPNDAK